MGSTKPVRQLYCHKCRSKYDHVKNFEEHHPEVYQNIKVVDRIGDHVLCKCLTCGHEYKTMSQRAMSIYQYLIKHTAA
jgi:predicted AAA+ superfamily ATPase